MDPRHLLNSTRKWVGLVLLAVLMVPVAQAKVFERWGADKTRGPAGRYGWEQAYESHMNLNGVEGLVRVFGVAKALPDVVDDLQNYYDQGGYSGEFFHGDPMAWGVGRDDKYAVRYFLQEGANASSTLIYEIRQSIAEYKKSQDKPKEHLLKAAPVYPGSVPTYYMKDYGSQTATEISSCTANPRTITEYYHRAMTDAGWGNRLGDVGSMRVFEKGKELVLISASEGADGQSRIVRVHKKLSVKK